MSRADKHAYTRTHTERAARTQKDAHAHTHTHTRRTRFSRRRSIATSSSHGRLLAASRNTKALSSFNKPSIWPPQHPQHVRQHTPQRHGPTCCDTWMSSSVFMRRLASCSAPPPPPPPRWPIIASSSSIKMVEGAWYLYGSHARGTIRDTTTAHISRNSTWVVTWLARTAHARAFRCRHATC